MAMVAGGQLGLVQGRARGQSESESLEKLGRGRWRPETATSGGREPQPRVRRCCWVSGRWCLGAEGGREGAKQ